MSAQAIVAVDGPNVAVSLEKLHGLDAMIDYRRLRETLWRDAVARLNTAELPYSTTVFLQDRSKGNLESLSQASFECCLKQSGWQIQKKARVEYPPELNVVYGDLENALTTNGFRAAERVRRVLRELAGARQDPWGGLPGNAKQDLRDNVRELVKVYGEHYRLATRMILRLVLPVLIVGGKFAWARKMLERILVEAWVQISEAEQGQEGYALGARDALACALVSSLDWPDKSPDVDLTLMDNQELIKLARSARNYLRQQREELHRAGDIDDILSGWVRDMVRPDMQRRAELPAVVYLVGNDYRNHLVLAERMQRYGAQVVLVLLQRHLVRASPETIAQVQSYQTIWLENFIERGSEGCTAA